MIILFNCTNIIIAAFLFQHLHKVTTHNTTCLEANLQAARLTSPEVIVAGVALNTSRLAPEAAARACREVEEALGVPAEDPVTMGVSRIVDRLQADFAG